MYCAIFFMLVEIIGGIVSNSLAIITDAAHMLSDIGGFIVAIMALHLAAQQATKEYTYGFHQAEILGALISIMIVWALTAVLLYEAIQRFITPEELDAPLMLIISVIGFLVNLVLMQVLGHGHGHSHGGGHGHSHGHGGHDDHAADLEKQRSVAMQAAIAHVIGDMVQSLGVCLAAFLMWQQPFDIGVTDSGISRWYYADPCCTVLFSILVMYTTKSTVVNIVHNLMVKVPQRINPERLLHRLEGISQVDSIHDLHVWSIGSAEVLCTAHIVVNGAQNAMPVLKKAIAVASQEGIGHPTFQVEIAGEFDPADESHGILECVEKQGTASRSAADLATNKANGHAHAKEEGGHAHEGHSHEGHSHGGGHGHAHEEHGCEGHSHGGGHGHAH